MFPNCCAINSIEKVVGGQKSWEPSKGRLRLRKGQILQTMESWVWVNIGAQHSWYQEWAVHGRAPLHPSGHPYHQHSRYSCTFYHYISDLAMSSQTDVLSIIPAVIFSKQGKQDLAGCSPASWICSWDLMARSSHSCFRGSAAYYTNIYFSEGETKCMRPKSEKLCFFQLLPVGVWQAETNESEDNTVYSTEHH